MKGVQHCRTNPENSDCGSYTKWDLPADFRMGVGGGSGDSVKCSIEFGGLTLEFETIQIGPILYRKFASCC